jgi:hypothetical protein
LPKIHNRKSMNSQESLVIIYNYICNFYLIILFYFVLEDKSNLAGRE